LEIALLKACVTFFFLPVEGLDGLLELCGAFFGSGVRKGSSFAPLSFCFSGDALALELGVSLILIICLFLSILPLPSQPRLRHASSVFVALFRPLLSGLLKRKFPCEFFRSSSASSSLASIEECELARLETGLLSFLPRRMRLFLNERKSKFSNF